MGGVLSGLLTAESYEDLWRKVQRTWSFAQHIIGNRDAMLKVMRNHRRAAYNADKSEYEDLTIKPTGINPNYIPEELVTKVRELWDNVVDLGEVHGFRNAQSSVIAPTGTIGLLMDCDTTGIEPDFSLVKFEKLAGGGYFKIINKSVPVALQKLGYEDEQIEEIIAYATGHKTFKQAPFINHESLKAKAFGDEELQKIEEQLVNAFDISFVFNKFVLAEEFLKDTLGFTEDTYDDGTSHFLETWFTKTIELLDRS